MKQAFFKKLSCAVACAAAFLMPAAQAADKAADYPSKPITLLVGFTAGGPSDTAARILAERLTSKWRDAHIVVENRAGANGSIAAAVLTKPRPSW